MAVNGINNNVHKMNGMPMNMYENMNSITDQNLKSSLPSVARVSEYEHANNSPYSSRLNSTLIYSSERGPVNSPQQQHIGSIADIDPLNNVYGSISKNPHSVPVHGNINNVNINGVSIP